MQMSDGWMIGWSVGRSEDSFDFLALRAFSISKSGRDDVGITRDEVGMM